MRYSYKRLIFVSTIKILILMLLFSCSYHKNYKNQVNSSESYLNINTLSKLKFPIDVPLSAQQSDDFGIFDNSIFSKGDLGKSLDIRPPIPYSTCLNKCINQINVNKYVLTIKNSNGPIWSNILQILEHNNFSIMNSNNVLHQLTTKWIYFNTGNENQSYRARYQINVQQHTKTDKNKTLIVKLLELKQKDTVILDPLKIKKYTLEMLNIINNNLNKIENDKRHLLKKDNKYIYANSSIDDNGIPFLTLNIPFNTTWNKLPSALKMIGMKVLKYQLLNGTFKIKYKNPNHKLWEKLNVRDPKLLNGKYRFQIGDLNKSHSSVHIIDPKGNLLTKSEIEKLVLIFNLILNK